MRKRRFWGGLTAGAALTGALIGSAARHAPADAAPAALHAPAATQTAPEAVSDVLAYTAGGTGGGGPLVRVTLDGGTPATFLLDTGTSDCAVTGAMAARLGLTPRATGQAAAPLIMDGDRATTVPLTIQVGRFRFPHYPTLVIKGSRFQEVLGQPLDGILGMGLLAHFALILAPDSHVLTLISPGGLTAAQVRARGFRRAVALPLTRSNGGTYWAAVGLANGARTARENLMIDTGAGTSVMSHGAGVSLGLTPDQRGLTVPFGNGAFVGDLVSVPVVTLGMVPVGTDPARPALTWRDGVFLYPSRPEAAVSPHVLGMNILSGYSVLLDFPGGTLYLQPLKTAE